MKIVVVSNHACVRMHKIHLPMIESGKHEVHLIAGRHTSFSEAYSTFSHWLELGQLSNAIKLHAKDADIFHVHNEPSWFVTMIKETCDVPVILDIHDSFAARITKEEKAKNEDLVRNTTEERNNFQLADALVFPGNNFAELVKKEYNLKQPSVILPSYLPRRMFRYNGSHWLGGLVYEGKVQLNTDTDLSHAFNYCNYRELAEKCHEIKMDFHLYAGRDGQDFKKVYDPIAFVHRPYVFDQLLKYISRHDWGLVGNIFPTQEWDVAFPNKLFEYIAAGVPVVAINARECGEFVEKHEIGIAVKSLEELGSRWREHERCRNNLLKKRVQFSMEKNNQQLLALYDDLIKGAPSSNYPMELPVDFKIPNSFIMQNCEYCNPDNGKKLGDCECAK